MTAHGHRMTNVGSGTVRVDSDHRAMGPDAMTEAMTYALKSKTHLWIMAMTHRISVDALARMDVDPPLFDAESLLASNIGCFICEQPYERQLLRRACPGDPPDSSEFRADLRSRLGKDD